MASKRGIRVLGTQLENATRVLLGTNKFRFRGHDLFVVGVRIGTVTDLRPLYALTGGLQLPRVTGSVAVVIATTYKWP